ncbi:MAG: hypothetical protein ABI905_00025 [Betaproteobacteria bacterium]
MYESARRLRRQIAFLVHCIVAVMALPAVAVVLPPVRPPGSALIKVEPGQSKDVTRLLKHAHLRKVKVAKDPAHVDSKRDETDDADARKDKPKPN